MNKQHLTFREESNNSFIAFCGEQEQYYSFTSLEKNIYQSLGEKEYSEILHQIKLCCTCNPLDYLINVIVSFCLKGLITTNSEDVEFDLLENKFGEEMKKCSTFGMPL